MPLSNNSIASTCSTSPNSNSSSSQAGVVPLAYKQARMQL